jgi:hypothetical protein
MVVLELDLALQLTLLSRIGKKEYISFKPMPPPTIPGPLEKLRKNILLQIVPAYSHLILAEVLPIWQLSGEYQ